MAAIVNRFQLRVDATGSSLPGPPVETGELLERIESRFGVKIVRAGRRIADRLGIRLRHHCRDYATAVETPRAGDCNPSLVAKAVRQALDSANLPCDAVGYLIGHTTSPHSLLPPNAAWAADKLSYTGPYVELRQACAGFANAIQLAGALLTTESVERVAIAGSETGHVFLDPRVLNKDREQLVNLVQMGDGAGAIVLSRADSGESPVIEFSFFGCAGLNTAPGFTLAEGGSGCPYPAGAVLTFRHDFDAVRRKGLALFEWGLHSVREAGLDPAQMDWILPHQANASLPSLLQDSLGVDATKVIVDCDRVGNLGSASIWVALDRFIRSGRLSKGQSILVLGAEATKFMYGGFVYRH
jgi:3-oxoacyl-[acyl-carrier-protein] synthase-3